MPRSSFAPAKPVEGFKLVERRAERKWVDDQTAKEIILNETERDERDIMHRTLKSPAQIEKLVGKKNFMREQLGAHVVKKSSGLKLVPEDHPSPPVLFGGTEFDTLPAPSSDNEGKDNEKNEQ
jgi:hypothetical protein